MNVNDSIQCDSIIETKNWIIIIHFKFKYLESELNESVNRTKEIILKKFYFKKP